MRRSMNAEIRSMLGELSSLSRKAALNEQERNRKAYLLAAISVLKNHSDMTPSDFSNESDADKQCRRAAWNTFLLSPAPELNRRMQEQRALYVGGLWGRPSGLSYDGGS